MFFEFGIEILVRGLKHLRQCQIYFQAVGLYGFDTQTFVEGGSSHLNIRIPKSGRVCCLCRNVECIESVHSLC